MLKLSFRKTQNDFMSGRFSGNIGYCSSGTGLIGSPSKRHFKTYNETKCAVNLLHNNKYWKNILEIDIGTFYKK
jgi:hypothetical protein